MKNEIIVQRLIEYTDKITRYTENCDYDTFSENSMLVEACVFNLSQMGEMANRIDEKYEQSHPDIPWRFIYGLRNRIVHDYEGVNLQLIWEIIRDDLPELRARLSKL